MNTKFDVKGMTCSACSAAVEKEVSKLEGVLDVRVNLLTNSMQVNYDENLASTAAIEKAVDAAGYSAAEVADKAGHASRSSEAVLGKPSPVQELEHSMRRRLLVSFIFLIPLMYISMGPMINLPLPGWLNGPGNELSFALTQFLLTLPVVAINFSFFSNGFRTLWKRHPNMDSLIAIGSGAALVYGIFSIYKIGYGLGHMQPDLVKLYVENLYFESAATILTLITLGKYLESRSKGKTSEAIAHLLALAPKTAIVIKDGKEEEIPIEDVQVGDVLLVRPGSTFPVDGVLTEGRTAVDMSALTGESIPVEKQAGDGVAAATINQTGSVRMKATKVGEDTALAQIIRLVEEAGSTKAPISRLADKISGIFVPTVISIALLAMIAWLIAGRSFEFSLSIAIAVLVISCPCALGLATPVAIMVGTGVGAKNGILFKSAEVLEILHKIDAVVLDKTGTITEGKPAVTDIISRKGLDKDEFLAQAAALEKPSEHPLAYAIIQAALAKELQIEEATDYEAIAGRGLVAKLGQEQWQVGNQALMEDFNIDVSAWLEHMDRLAYEGKTPLLFASKGEIQGLIAVADTIKPESPQAITRLKKMGLETIMLTGDNERTAQAIGRKVEVDQVKAEVMPADKDEVIRSLQESGKTVAMIGDGINDAPALVRADAGLAIGTGTDIAIEAADLVLMKNNLNDAVTAIKLSRNTIRNIKQNLFWAFFYNSAGIPLAAGLFIPINGWQLSPMFAAAAMSFSSVCVVLNALRLRRFKA